jgi:hypothetical protein
MTITTEWDTRQRARVNVLRAEAARLRDKAMTFAGGPDEEDAQMAAFLSELASTMEQCAEQLEAKLP